MTAMTATSGGGALHAVSTKSTGCYCSAVHYLVLDTYILYTTALCYSLLYSILISYIFMPNTITINRMWRFFLYVSESNKSMREENVRSRDNVSGR